MEKVFSRRAKYRMLIAYLLLVFALVVIVVGIGLMIDQLNDAGKKSLAAEPYNLVSRLSFLLLILFIVRILLKFYRYNVLKADYYLTCSDALKILGELDGEKIKTYEVLLAILTSDKTDLPTTKSPDLQSLKTSINE